jgi:HK97 family phage prohead protease
MQIEYNNTDDVAIIEQKDGKQYIQGYAARFYNGSADTECKRGGRVERIRPDAFDGVIDAPEVELRFNHNADFVLGNRETGLQLRKDNRGIIYTHPYDSTDPEHTRVKSKIDKHLIRGSSWKGTAQIEWDEEGNDRIMWITSVMELEDVSPVDRPAVKGSSAMVFSGTQLNDTELNKSFDDWKETKERIAIAESLIT